MKVLTLIYFINVALLSLVAFALYGKDKAVAGRNGAMRIRESVLLGVATCGGALGAFFGRTVFRHKTQKIYFSIVIYTSLVLQGAVAAFLLASLGVSL